MSDEELSLRHRRASEATAGAPSAAVRAAIKREAELQLAARRTVPETPVAANDSYWPMRAVAMLAVVAIAAGLWWQMRPQSSTPVAQVAEVAQTVQAAAELESRERRASLPLPSPPPAAVATSAAPSAAGAAIADTAPNPLAAEIARRLPDAWNSATPVDGLWVRLDARGVVVAAGQKVDERKASDISLARAANAPVANAQMGGETVELRNANGALLRISIQREATRP
jgi:hypothetical protein